MTAEKIISQLGKMNLNLRIMHVCGTHQDTLIRYGLDYLLKKYNIQIRQGPGCPVCVTVEREFEEAITLARNGITVATFGDVARAPTLKGSLLDQKTEGNDIRIVYSIEDAVEIASHADSEVVFMAAGFETTAPGTAVKLLGKPPPNFSVLSCHRYVPPALQALLEMGELKLNGLIEPGHVSTIIGIKPYEEFSLKYKIPQVVAGFEPLDMLISVYMLARQVEKGEAKVENEYLRSVRYEGNVRAIKVMAEVFEPYDVEWRGFPLIPASGMKIKRQFEQFDARKRFEDELSLLDREPRLEPAGCRCGEILRGLLDPEDCELFRHTCKPESPVGPCMVSIEGSCNIAYKYGKRVN